MKKFTKKLITLMFLTAALVMGAMSVQGATLSTELKGAWFSYLDWAEMPSDEASFKKAADAAMAKLQNTGMNAVFVHAHSHSDCYYPGSKYFPKSKFMTTKNSAPGFDPFMYMIESAHNHGLQFHAWFNPYRVTGYLMKWDDVPSSSIVKKWASNSSTKRNVLYHDGQYYLNPASKDVQDMFVASVAEVVEKYPVDGIQFDDYFYPTVTDSDSSLCFDKPEYDKSGSKLSIANWRRNNVSSIVARAHAIVKERRPGCVFGISPVCDFETLRKDNTMFVDIDKWMSTDTYIDYIMPQIYYGFEARTGEGVLADHSFTKNLNSWIALKKKGPVQLCLGLGLYRAGTNTWDGNEKSEWLRYDDIIARQVTAARKTGQVSGFGFYGYSTLAEATAQKEIANLKKVL